MATIDVNNGNEQENEYEENDVRNFIIKAFQTLNTNRCITDDKVTIKNLWSSFQDETRYNSKYTCEKLSEELHKMENEHLLEIIENSITGGAINLKDNLKKKI